MYLQHTKTLNIYSTLVIFYFQMVYQTRVVYLKIKKILHTPKIVNTTIFIRFFLVFNFSFMVTSALVKRTDIVDFCTLR